MKKMDKKDIIIKYRENYKLVMHDEDCLITPNEESYFSALAAVLTIYEIIKEEKQHEKN